MNENWKAVLYDYIQHHNKMDVEYTLEPIRPLLRDERYAELQNKRLRRLEQAHQSRGNRPRSCETRARIMHASEKHDQVVAYVQLRKSFRYNSAHIEQRMEVERVTLSARSGAWRLIRIEPDLSERLGGSRPQEEDTVWTPQISLHEAGNGADFWGGGISSTEGNGLPLSHSAPYLNRNLIHHAAPFPRQVRYNREQAAQYADRWWNAANPQFQDFDVDCTNFVSQCLYAGNAPMNYTGRRDTGWWYHGKAQGRELWSFSWAVADSFQRYLAAGKSGLRGIETDSPYHLSLGDVITYDWDGDNRYQHTVIVTAFDAFGNPLVNAHTTNSKHRYWDYRDSYAFTDRTRIRFFHVPDLL